jgi:hypothetical protein
MVIESFYEAHDGVGLDSQNFGSLFDDHRENVLG